ncbi:MAG: cupin domain-containing protein [Woeseiaceae bacterium]|nr:cupin domain-containing protein [Woeseiaceae bacterium]
MANIMKAVNLFKELELVDDYWSPRVVGEVNDQYIKVAKVKGTFTWHKHDSEDELFYVLRGQLIIEYENGRVVLNEGDFHVVPRGTMHNPVAEDECWIALIETVTTKHTGDVVTERTKSIEQQLGSS